MKVSAALVAVLGCDSCGLVLRGQVDNGYAVFDEPGVTSSPDSLDENPD
jgi:hypothetical protein